MKFGVIVFPGTWSDGDCYHVVDSVLGHEAKYVWHKDRNLSGLDCVILPGGFSYGDYLRTGAVARFSPVMDEVERFAARGGLVLGICNGFQILCEAGLLPGALMRNEHLQFRCQWVDLRVETNGTRGSRPVATRARCCACQFPTARATTTQTKRPSPPSTPTVRLCSATARPKATSRRRSTPMGRWRTWRAL